MTLKNIKIACITLLAFIIPGCGSHIPLSPLMPVIEIPKDIILRDTAGAPAEENSFDVTRLYDIFIPDNHALLDLSNKEHDKKMIVAFKSHASLEDLLDQYRTEMTHLGWEELANFDDSFEQCCLIFSRPSRLCTVVIARKQDGYGVTLFIGPKKQVNELPAG